MSSLQTNPKDSSTAAKSNNKDNAKGDKEKDGKALTPEEIDLAVAELRYQTAFYQEAVQAMMDGVTLGAQQVQDKRIELLEVGTTTSTGEVIFAIALTFVLEGTVGPAIASLATRAVLAPILKNASRAITIIKSRGSLSAIAENRATAAQYLKTALWDESFSGSRANLVLLAQELRTAANLLGRDLRRQLGSAKPIAKTLASILDFAEQNLNAVAKTPAAALGVAGSDVPLTDSDSPGVAIASAAMASAARLRIALIATHEALELEIKKPGSKVGDVGKMLNEYRVSAPVNFGPLREAYTLASEAMIWAQLLITNEVQKTIEWRNNMAWSDRDRNDPSLRGINALPLDTRIDAKLQKYLLARFSTEVERWALEFDAPTLTDLKRLSRTPRTTGWWQTLSDYERTDLLIQYLANVARVTPPSQLQLS